MKGDPVAKAVKSLATILTLKMKNKPVSLTVKNLSSEYKDRSLSTEVVSHGIVNHGGEPQFYLKCQSYYWHEPVTSAEYVLNDNKLVLTGRIEQAIATIDLT